MRIPMNLVRIGDCLGSDTFNSFGLLVLSKNTVLTFVDIACLHRHEIYDVDIMLRHDDSRISSAVTQPVRPENLEYVEQLQEPLEKESFKKIMASYQEAVTGIKQIFEHAMETGSVSQEMVDSCFMSLIEKVQQEKDVVYLLLVLNTKDDYTYQHSVQVGIISYYLSKWVGESEEQAIVAGKAGYIHDIGKCRIDAAILQKPGRLTDDEYTEIKKHSQYGFDIVKSSGFAEALCLATLQHHERLDGSGYPFYLKEHEIHPLSRIIAVADIYSAMICNRVYQKKRDLLHVLQEIHRCSFGELDPKVTHAFMQNMVPNFIGKKIQLASGEFGTIVMTHPSDYFRPLIRVDGQFIDLLQRSELEIERIYV